MISCAVTAQLICVFVFAYAKKRLSHNEAHINHNYAHEQDDLTYLSSLNFQDILSGLQNTKKHSVIPDAGDYMAVAESIITDQDGVMKGYADRRKPPGKTSYMYKFDWE